MNRIISLSVEDMYIKYTGEAFGATGSHNAVTLRMTFGFAWEGTAKTAYFTDALGNTSVALVLGLDTLVDGAYEVDVPSEALKTAGVATITIKGVLVSGETTTKAITTAAGHFRVLDSELPDSAGSAGTITPSDKDQLQAEIASMEALFTTAKAAAEAAAANAKVSETNAKTSETAAASSASSAEASKTAAAESAATATAQASAADASATKAATSQKAASASESAAKASETAAKAAQTGAETAKSNAKDSATAAAGAARSASGAATAASGSASDAHASATAASSSASQAQASAAAAAQSAASVDGINKTAQSWAVGGTGTRPGEDTDNAKYWAKRAEGIVSGDVFYVDLTGEHNDGTGQFEYTTAMTPDQITKAYTSGKSIVCRLVSEQIPITLPLFMPGDQTGVWVFSGSGAIDFSADDRFAAQTFTVALVEMVDRLVVLAQNTVVAIQADLVGHVQDTAAHVADVDRIFWNNKAGKALTFTVTLTAAGWSGNAQTVSNSNFAVSGYAYTVCPAGDSFAGYAEAVIYADDVTAAGKMTFHCSEKPTANLTVNILRMEVEA